VAPLALLSAVPPRRRAAVRERRSAPAGSCFTEFSLNMFYAQALVVVWFAVVGALMLRDARAPG